MGDMMKNLTTPQAILFGFGLVALAIASIPYSSQVVTPALASSHGVHKIAICDETGTKSSNVLSRSETKKFSNREHHEIKRLFLSGG